VVRRANARKAVGLGLGAAGLALGGGGGGGGTPLGLAHGGMLLGADSAALLSQQAMSDPGMAAAAAAAAAAGLPAHGILPGMSGQVPVHVQPLLAAQVSPQGGAAGGRGRCVGWGGVGMQGRGAAWLARRVFVGAGCWRWAGHV
jgi:hypothetical protein